MSTKLSYMIFNYTKTAYNRLVWRPNNNHHWNARLSSWECSFSNCNHLPRRKLLQPSWIYIKTTGFHSISSSLFRV